MSPKLKEATPQPAGSLPEGLLNKVMVGLSTALILALIISVGFCGGGESPADANADAETTPPGADAVRPGQPVEAELQEAIARQQEELAAADRAAAAAASQRLLADQRASAAAIAAAAEAAVAEAAAARTLTPAMRQALFDSLGVLPDPDMREIQRQAELEAMARQITSVRASPVALTFRGSSQSAPTGGGETDDPTSAALLDALARGRALIPGQSDAQPPGGELEIPVPSSLRLPDYANPPRLLTPDDPPGWARIHEGSFLEAVLVNQIEGEFPGPVLATVSVPFYSADRQRVLIPRGARLIGSAQAVRRRDQSAIAVGFHRLIFLDGRHVPLRFIGLDQAGATGLRDQVNRHYLSTFLAAGAVGLFSGFALVAGNPYGGGAGGLLAATGSGTAEVGDDILDRFLNRLPEITIRPGQRLRVWLTSDVLIPIPPPS